MIAAMLLMFSFTMALLVAMSIPVLVILSVTLHWSVYTERINIAILLVAGVDVVRMCFPSLFSGMTAFVHTTKLIALTVILSRCEMVYFPLNAYYVLGVVTFITGLISLI